MLTLDSIYTNQTNWKPAGRDVWEQEFRIELERVSDLLFSVLLLAGNYLASNNLIQPG